MQTIFSNIIKKTGCTSRARIQGRDDKERYTGIALLGNCRYPNAHLVRRLPRNLSQSAALCRLPDATAHARAQGGGLRPVK